MIQAPEDADDVFQEVWVRVIRNVDRYRHKTFRGWLFRICHNLLIDRARSRRNVASLDAPLGPGGEMT